MPVQLHKRSRFADGWYLIEHHQCECFIQQSQTRMVLSPRNQHRPRSMRSTFTTRYSAMQKRVELHRIEVTQDASRSMVLQRAQYAVFSSGNPISGRPRDRDVDGLLRNLHINVSDAPRSGQAKKLAIMGCKSKIDRNEGDSMLILWARPTLRSLNLSQEHPELKASPI